MKGAVSKYLALDSSQRSTLNKAFLQLARMRIALPVCSFHNFVSGLQMHPTEIEPDALAAQQLNKARMIGWAVSAAAANLPWNNSCLVQALVAQRMLKSNGISGVLYLGAALGAAETTQAKLAAHAWVKSGGEFITGEQGSKHCKSMVAYAWP